MSERNQFLNQKCEHFGNQKPPTGVIDIYFPRATFVFSRATFDLPKSSLCTTHFLASLHHTLLGLSSPHTSWPLFTTHFLASLHHPLLGLSSTHFCMASLHHTLLSLSSPHFFLTFLTLYARSSLKPLQSMKNL
jgi:hypothetical protein